MKHLILFLYILFSSISLIAQEKEVRLKFIETSDIHGNFYPYNFIEKRPWEGSLARVDAFCQEKRKIYGNNLILIDNGDILQGQPTVYYYNFIDTVSTHLAAEVMNFMGYNAGNMGNHDVETGHPVYDRWISQCNFPVLGANIIHTFDGTNYLKPYQILVREGIKIAILGMITPAIPTWLPPKLWEGLRFDDMEQTARKWMKIIREQEKPDIIIGLFHSGKDAIRIADKYNENASLDIARKVPGFDIIMMGHDHLKECSWITNIAGDSVLIIDPGSNGLVVGDVEARFILKDGKIQSKYINGSLTDVSQYKVSKRFMQRFAPQYAEIQKFISQPIGIFDRTIMTEDAYFGPSAFIDLIHSLQLELTGADISFTAPLSFDARINEGEITVSDMFNLYKYENMLYTMRLTGKEIKNFLEMSYALWTNQMKTPEDPLLLLKPNQGNKKWSSFVNYSFNFDSAAGIIYTVDVTKPQGEKIRIISMTDGTPFYPDKSYTVALNSYRGNGGGELLTKGAGIPQEELNSRIITSTDKDLRFYLIEYITQKYKLSPQPLGQWKFIPEEWVKPAVERDRKLLFGH